MKARATGALAAVVALVTTVILSGPVTAARPGELEFRPGLAAAPAGVDTPPSDASTLVAELAGLPGLDGRTLALPQDAETPPASPAPVPPAPAKDLTVTVAFAGDVLTHEAVHDKAKRKGGYDYSKLLAGADRWIAGADLAICQLEVPVAPKGTKPSGYPVFGAPAALVRDLAEQGWDGCATATNHAADRGWAGVKATIGALKGNRMGYSGTALTRKDAEQAQFYKLAKDGRTITIAHLSTTYGLNGFKQPRPYAVATNDVARIKARAKTARKAGADIVLLSVHEGVEYRLTPSPAHKKLLKAIAASGAMDAVIGGHPHVAEPVTRLPGKGGTKVWTAYSLGNYISNMHGDHRDTGVILYLSITARADGRVGVDKMTWAGVTMASGCQIKVLQNANGKRLGSLSAKTVKHRLKLLKKALGTTAREQRRPPVPSGATLTVVPRKP